MKTVILVSATLFFLEACNTANDGTAPLRAQIGSLRQELKKSHRRGAGDAQCGDPVRHLPGCRRPTRRTQLGGSLVFQLNRPNL